MVPERRGSPEDPRARFVAEFDDDYVELPVRGDVREQSSPDVTRAGAGTLWTAAERSADPQGMAAALISDSGLPEERQVDHRAEDELRVLFENLAPGDTLQLTVGEASRGRSPDDLLLALQNAAASFGLELEFDEIRSPNG